MLKRRQFLHGMMGGLAAGTAWLSCGPVSFKIRSAHAQSAPGKTLIMVFMRGGADGLYLCVPYGDPDYYGLRPTCYIDPPGNGADSAIDLDGYFGLNPNFAALKEIWDDGNLAICPATHLSGSHRSHFDNQRWVGYGQINNFADGWMQRVLKNSSNTSPLRGLVAGSSSSSHELFGSDAYPAIAQASDYSLEGSDWCSGTDCAENRLLQRLAAAYANAGGTGQAVQKLLQARGLSMVNSLQLVAGVDSDYAPSAGGLTYSGSPVGRGLRLTAQLLKGGVPLECVEIDWNGGWDSHNNQRLANQSPTQSNAGLHKTQRDGAENLLCFHRDMADLRNNVAVLIGTEFGRTSLQNGTNGTDHGYAACWWMLGGGVDGGKIKGAWPTLAPDRLKDGRYLDNSFDCRDLMAEAVVKHLGYPESVLPALFPGHTYTNNNVLT